MTSQIPFADRTARTNWLCIVAVVAAALTGLSIVQSIRQQRETAVWVAQTADVLFETGSLALHVQQAVAEARVWRLAAGQADPARFAEAMRQANAGLAKLGGLTAESPAQQHALRRLGTLINARLGRLNGAMPAAAPVAALADVTTGIVELQAAERTLLLARRASLARAQAHTTLLLVIGGGVFSASLMMAIVLAVARVRQEAESRLLAELNVALDRRVAERTTELRDVADRLAISEEWRQRIMDHAPIAMVIMKRRLDDQYVYDYMNLACEDTYGEPRCQFLGRTLHEVWPKDVADNIDGQFGRCARIGTPFPFLVTREVNGEVRMRDGTLSRLGTEREGAEPDRPDFVLICTWDVTRKILLERRVAEQQAALRRKEAMLENTGRLARVGGWEYDLQTGAFAWSAQTFRLHGLAPGAEPSLDDAIACYAPEARPMVRAMVERCAADGTGFDLDLPFLRAGERIWVRAFGEAVMENGRPVRLMGAIQEVTDEVKQRRALKDANTRVHLATETAGIGIWEWKAATDEITWDAQTFKLYGATLWHGPLRIEFWTSRVHPEDVAAAWPGVSHAAGDGGKDDSRYDTAFRIVRDDGGIRHLRATGNIMRDAQGEIDRILGVTWDITEAHELAALGAEQAARLAHSEANARLILDNSRDVISRVDVNGVRLYASAATYRLFGVPPDGFVTRGIASFVHPDDLAQLTEAEAQLCAGDIADLSITFRILAADRVERWVEKVASGLRDEHGKPVGYISALRDVTERVRMEEEREERTRDLRLANTELDRLMRDMALARQIAEQANRAKSRFLAGMSHELRTPLNGILGYAQLLRMDGQLTPSQAGRVNAMVTAGNHLLEMISCVLDLSEIETEDAEVRIASMDLFALANACLDIVRPAAEARGLVLRQEIARDLPRYVMSSVTRLRQVLLNLLGNAVKYTPAGTVALRLGTAAAADGAPRLRLEVADTGPGIRPALRHLLFEAFERLGADSESNTEGAGLGLSLAKRLAVLLGGELRYEDNPGGGSIFVVDLPLVAGNAPAAAPLLLAPERPMTVAMAVPDGHILVVDDIAMNRDIAETYIRSAGYAVTCAESGEEALALAAANDFALILMDIRMPGMDGLEATRQIRALAGPRSRVPVVALTAQAFTEQIAECRAAGMDSHVVKPFTHEALLDEIARSLDGGRAAPPALVSDALDPGPATTVGVADLPDFNLELFVQLSAMIAPDLMASHVRALGERMRILTDVLRDGACEGAGLPRLLTEVHALGGIAGQFGFERLAAVSKQFERAAERDPRDAPGLADRLHTALRAALAALEHGVEGCGPAPAHEPGLPPSLGTPDRLLGRMDNATMRALYQRWHSVRAAAGRLPSLADLAGFDDELSSNGFVLSVVPDAGPADMRVERIGTALTDRLGKDLTGALLIAADEELLGSASSTYRRCFTGRPQYDYAIISLGRFGKMRFERLLLPIAEAHDKPDRVIGYAIFADPSAPVSKEVTHVAG
jgi:PAS domain S-box-containing protein